MKDYLIIAHRGSSFEAPENTLPAVNLAWSQNADAVEVDIHLTKDKHLVVIHDSGTLRTSGRNKKIINTNLEELQKLDVGSWKGLQWAETKIPTLTDVISTVPSEKKLFIEIKGGDNCLEVLKKLLFESHLNPDQIIIMDFDLDVVKKAKKHFPELEILWLLEFGIGRLPSLVKKKIKKAIQTAKKYNLNGLNIENVKALDKNMINIVKGSNLKCYCWTVNNLKRAHYLIENGINGITTDRPKYLIENTTN